MWVEKLSTGQFKYFERYKDPLTEKWKKVSVTMNKNDKKTYKLAKEHLSIKIDTILNSTDIDKVTLSMLIEKYLTFQKDNVKPSTYRRNFHCMNFFKNTFGEDTLVKQINARYIRERLDATGKENSTKNEFLKRFKAMLRWGYQNDYIESVEYLNKLTPYKDNTRKIELTEKYLEAEEIKLLMANLNSTSYTAYIDLTEFLLLSGLRIGEALALEKSSVKGTHIPVRKNYDYVNGILYDTPKNDPSNRDVFIQEELKALLNRINVHNRIRKVSSPYLFHDDEGKRIDYYNYNNFIKNHSKKALRREITPHIFRHTHASLLIAKGIDVDTVSRRLGHADSKITKEIYIHIMNELKERDANKIKKLKLI